MARAATTSDVFNAVGDPTRRHLIEVLSAAESSVGDLVAVLGMPQPQISQHLKVLRDVDVVVCRHDGRRRLYALHRAALRPIDDWLARLTVQVNEHYDRLDDYLVELQRSTPELSTHHPEEA